MLGWFLNVLVNNLAISRTGHKTERLTILRAATHEIELGDHDLERDRERERDTERERQTDKGNVVKIWITAIFTYILHPPLL